MYPPAAPWEVAQPGNISSRAAPFPGIIVRARFIKILSTSEFTGGIYEQSKFNALQP